MKVIKIIVGWVVGVFLLLQLIQIKIPPAPKATPQDEIKAPQKVIAILKRSCYDCHSNHVKIPWYGHIAPFSIGVHSNIKNGRAWLNFSIFNQYSKERQEKLFKQIAHSVRFKMPPKEYLWIHKDAKLSKNEIELLRKWALSHIKDENSSN